MNILIDGMGGDYAPQEIVKGAISAARKIEDTITIIGAQELIGTELEKRGWDGDNIAVVNATEAVTNNEAPAMAVRKKKDATVNVGMRMIKAGDSDVFISGDLEDFQEAREDVGQRQEEQEPRVRPHGDLRAVDRKSVV